MLERVKLITEGRRSFFDVFENLGSNQNAFQRREAMQVGDYIEMHWGYFSSLISFPIERPDDASKKSKLSPKGNQVVKVVVTRILPDSNHIIVVADGVEKEIDASLFYNYYRPAQREIEIGTNGYIEGFRPPDDTVDRDTIF